MILEVKGDRCLVLCVIMKNMYYPQQIPYLLDEKFRRNIEYAEYSADKTAEVCECFWTMKTRKMSEECVVNNILPDACIDIVIDFVERRICFAGFSRETEPFELKQKIDYLGARLRPGAFYALFGVRAEKVMDRKIDFTGIERDDNLLRILDLKETSERLEYLQDFLTNKIHAGFDQSFIKIVEKLYINPKDQSVVELANELGYNTKQMYRVFKTHYGVSPKVLLNILRLHLCLTMMLNDGDNLTRIANDCGFYDQAHFVKEIKRYTGFSPVKLLKNV